MQMTASTKRNGLGWQNASPNGGDSQQHRESKAQRQVYDERLPDQRRGDREGNARPCDEPAAAQLPQIGQQQRCQRDAKGICGEKQRGHDDGQRRLPRPRHKPAAKSDVPAQVRRPEQSLAQAVGAGVARHQKKVVGKDECQPGSQQGGGQQRAQGVAPLPQPVTLTGKTIQP